MQFSLFFFGADSEASDRYRLLFDAARFADNAGFTALWVPERHFTRFGGLYGSASVMAAALAAATRKLGIRAGSVIIPLHHPLRVAEEWSIIDNICGGRVGIAAASGWHVNDFVLAPDHYHRRRDIMYERTETIRKLWRGESVSFANGEHHAVGVRIFPAPVQPELPIWLTTSSEPGAEHAGEMGFNLLTSNFTHAYDAQRLSTFIAIYRQAMQRSHHARGHVTLMLHTYVGASQDMIDSVAVPAMARYLEANIELQRQQDEGQSNDRGYGRIEGRRRGILAGIAARQTVEHNLNFIAPFDVCRRRVRELEQFDVDEIACLIDFGVPFTETMEGLGRLAKIVAEFRG